MTPRQILRWWEDAHFKLGRLQSQSFLAKSEVDELCKLPADVVERSVRRHQKLKAALIAASAVTHKLNLASPPRAASPVVRPAKVLPKRPQNGSRPTPKSKKAVASRRPPSRPKPAPKKRSASLPTDKWGNYRPTSGSPGAGRNDYRKWGPTGRPPESPKGPRTVGPSGLAGANAGYHTGLSRNPGAPEMAIGDRCEHCGAFIPSGSGHECHF